MDTVRVLEKSDGHSARVLGIRERRRIGLAAAAGLVAGAVVLGAVAAATGLGVAGWITGLVAAPVVTALLVAARMRSDEPTVHPADWVTLTRAVLSACIAGLVADSFTRHTSAVALVTLASIALVSDVVDGQVARRTGTATVLGVRLDGEVDAFLILLLSIAVSQSYGRWVLAIGAARYLLLIASWLVSWLAAPLPPRLWRKTVAAIQGIVLTAAATGQLSRIVGIIAVAVALLLLAESFGRDVIWLYRHGATPRSRLVLRVAVTVVSAALVWAVLLVPDRELQITPAAFIRIPLEGLILVAVAMALPRWPRRILVGIVGLLVGVLTIVKILNIAFYIEVGRAFNPVLDLDDIGPAVGVVRDAIGNVLTDIALVAVWLVLLLVVAAIIAAALRVSTEAARHRRPWAYGLVAIAVVWGLLAGLSVQIVRGSPVASASEAGLAESQYHSTHAALIDQRRFDQAINGADPESSVPASTVLTGLRGKDVLLVFVESYGQVAVQGTPFSAGVDNVLSHSNASLTKAGYSMQSAWLNSPTYGGISWLAHSTMESGLWVNTNQRYSELTASQRYTLSDAFLKGGWHTVVDDPSDDYSWPPGKTFYHFDQLFDRRNVGYHGPTFSYASMPDQYALTAFQRNELPAAHKPVFAEIDLVSSHTPWAPLPKLVPWDKVGNGSIFDAQPGESETPEKVWRSAATVQQFYGMSIQYTLTALTQWIVRLNDPNLVMIMLGDHQPNATVSGQGSNHVVPVSIIAKDPSVFSQISSWNWQNGLKPGASAPLEPMDAFRNQFLNAFSKPSPGTTSARKPAASAAP